MTTWNTLTLEVRSNIVKIITLNGIEDGLEKAQSSPAYILFLPAFSDLEWEDLDNLLVVAPDLRAEAQRIASRHEEESARLVAHEREEKKKAVADKRNTILLGTVNNHRFYIVKWLLRHLKEPATDVRLRVAQDLKDSEEAATMDEEES